MSSSRILYAERTIPDSELQPALDRFLAGLTATASFNHNLQRYFINLPDADGEFEDEADRQRWIEVIQTPAEEQSTAIDVLTRLQPREVSLLAQALVTYLAAQFALTPDTNR